jgi:hypothetical protein
MSATRNYSAPWRLRWASTICRFQPGKCCAMRPSTTRCLRRWTTHARRARHRPLALCFASSAIVTFQGCGWFVTGACGGSSAHAVGSGLMVARWRDKLTAARDQRRGLLRAEGRERNGIHHVVSDRGFAERPRHLSSAGVATLWSSAIRRRQRRSWQREVHPGRRARA